MRSAERRKANVVEIRVLRCLVVVSRMDRVRNEEVRKRAGIERVGLGCGKNGRLLYAQRGADGGSKWRTGTR